MADSDNQQAPSVNDDASSGQGLAVDLKKLAHAVYANRGDEAKWQELLQQATDDVIAMVSADPSVLSDVLGAESEAEVDTIIDGILAKHHATESQLAASEPASEDAKISDAAESSTQSDNQPDDKREKDNADEAQSDQGQMAKSTTELPTESTQSADAKGAQASIETNVETQDNTTAQVGVGGLDDERILNDEFADFLASIYAVKDKDDGVDRLLQKADSKMMERMYSNPFYLTRVMEMTNENELKDLLELVRRPSGPFYADDQPQMAAVTDENIDYVLDNYAFINFDCIVTDPENSKLKDLIKSMPEPSWFSSTGVPVSCQLSDDRKTMTISVSLRGTLEGFDPATVVEESAGDVNTMVPDVLDSAVSKRMIVASELLEMIQSMGLDQVKIRAGRRVMMRNLWALLTVNDIELTGFEPSPAEQAWLDKRAHFLTDQFRLQDQAAAIMAPGMGRGSSDAGAVSDAVATTDSKLSNEAPMADEARSDVVDTEKAVGEAAPGDASVPSTAEDKATAPKKKPVTKKAAVGSVKKSVKKSSNTDEASKKTTAKLGKKSPKQDES